VASLTSLVARDGVRAASGVATAAEDRAAGRVLPVPAELAGLLPWGGLRRGSTVSVRGSTSLLLALLATATAEGSWAAVVGVPEFGLLAAAEFGVAVHRLALVPRPGAEFPSVVAALLDGVDLVAAAPPGTAMLPESPVAPRNAARRRETVRPAEAAVAEDAGSAPPQSGRPTGDEFDPRVARRLSARARQRGAVLLPLGRWPAPDVELSCTDGQWSGLGQGHGFLRQRRVRVLSRGRGSAARPRRADVLLPAASGTLGPAVSGAGSAAAAFATSGAVRSTMDETRASTVDFRVGQAVSAVTRDLVAAGLLVAAPDDPATRVPVPGIRGNQPRVLAEETA
jgi:hypothetical protein